MESRSLACVIAATIIGTGLTTAATQSSAKNGPKPVVVEGNRVDPSLQRRVSYADLDLAIRPNQRILRSRIYRTANDLCYDLSGYDFQRACSGKAVHSTDDQVASAIERAQRKMAGLPVGPAVAISILIGAN
jgi:UrcA family protein